MAPKREKVIRRAPRRLSFKIVYLERDVSRGARRERVLHECSRLARWRSADFFRFVWGSLEVRLRFAWGFLRGSFIGSFFEISFGFLSNSFWIPLNGPSFSDRLEFVQILFRFPLGFPFSFFFLRFSSYPLFINSLHIFSSYTLFIYSLFRFNCGNTSALKSASLSPHRYHPLQPLRRPYRLRLLHLTSKPINWLESDKAAPSNFIDSRKKEKVRRVCAPTNCIV